MSAVWHREEDHICDGCCALIVGADNGDHTGFPSDLGGLAGGAGCIAGADRDGMPREGEAIGQAAAAGRLTIRSPPRPTKAKNVSRQRRPLLSNMAAGLTSGSAMNSTASETLLRRGASPAAFL